jgi:membrane fusion protein, copper/silver efflux system
MKHKEIINVALAAGLAVAVGYWWGHSTGSDGDMPATGNDASGPLRHILYYRNPMGHGDTSPVPKKDSMGMDYVPVYADDVSEGPQVRISPDRLQTMGVQTERAASRTMSRTIRAVGTVEASERSLYTISSKFEGWITTLFVNTTGTAVRRGQPLAAVFSPELVAAQEEYRSAAEALMSMDEASAEAQAGMKALVDGSLQRLRNWDIDDADLADLKKGKAVRQSLTLRSRTDGVVIEMKARNGMRFMPGEPLFQIADLSNIWVVARVYEHDLGTVRAGQTATVSFAAYPGRPFTGQVSFVYPTVDPGTRTSQIRIELQNKAGLLKPNLYGIVEIEAGGNTAAVAIPESAVLDSGTRKVVLVDLGGGAFEPREVEIGSRGDGYVEVVKGLAAGQPVVVNGNFLIDAESNLKSALRGLGGQANGAAAETEADVHKEH